MGTSHDRSTDFLPVVTADQEELLDSVLSHPFSYVSTTGPIWRTARQREQFIADDGSSHLVVRVQGNLVGAVTWSTGQTPGYYRLTIISADDDAWTPHLVEAAIREAISMIARSSEAKRIELLVPGYDIPLVDYLTATHNFEIEGVLRDRFFIDGRYWPGIICRADIEKFRPQERASNEERAELLDRLRDRAMNDLSSAQTRPF
ncbi:hypothetical protein [Nocardiopsis rhodophaea]|uniref:hypothetical protein n=1 Tax=Nocardiopsis rhodophaea TaxID=280238 RepID=UPI0031E0311A